MTIDRDNLNDPIVSENAAKVLAERYLAKDSEGKPIEDPKGMYLRVASHVAKAEKTEDKRDFYTIEFYNLMAENRFMPNSPCLMNAGRKLGLLSACFVLPVHDNIESITDTQKNVIKVQRAGGGTGFSFSRLRPNRSIVRSSGGTTAGPISFIDAYSASTTAIQQGAFRRGANMAILDCDHPDIIDFIKVKSDLSRWQNYNVSIAVTDKFMELLETKPTSHHLVSHSEWGTGSLWKKIGSFEIKAFRDSESPDRTEWDPWTIGETFSLICQRAWETGEPGLFFIDEANRNCPIQNVGRIVATNPCGEQPLHDHDSCNLGSINLSKCTVTDIDGNTAIDWDELKRTVRTAVRFLDNVIEVNNFPIPEIEEMAHKTRRIGLGVMGWADLLYLLKVPYSSSEATKLAENIMQTISDTAANESQNLANEKGNFGAWEGSKYSDEAFPQPMRNSYRTTVAPTGTISIISNCSGGIEPLFALAFMRTVMPDNDGKFIQMTEVNPYFSDSLEKSGITEETKTDIIKFVLENGSLQHYSPKYTHEVDAIQKLKEIFLVSHDLTMEQHVDMQAAWQKYVDSAISKTINLNKNSSVSDVKDAYLRAYYNKCKGITVYRDGCRDGVAGMKQPMAVKSKTKEKLAESNVAIKEQETTSEPTTPIGFQHALKTTMRTQFGSLHVNLVLDDSGNLYEFFAQVGKAGDVIASDLEAICRLGSLLLRNGVSIDEIVEQLKDIGSTEIMPSEFGKIISLPDAIGKVLHRYNQWVKNNVSEKVSSPTVKVAFEAFDSSATSNYGIVCPSCGSKQLQMSEGCKTCLSCGYSAC